MSDIQIKLSSSLKPLPDSSALGFGQHFTDHWFFSKYSDDKGWFESRVEPYGPIALDPGASVLHYGQALFEGMKAFARPDGSIFLFRPEFNWERLREGAERLCLPSPPRELFMRGLTEVMKVDARWVPKENNCSLYIRPTLIGTEAFLGVRPSREALFYILLSPAGSYYSEGYNPLRIWVEDQDLRAAPGGLGATKAGANYAASLRAALAAKKKGYAQVLWLDAQREGIEEVGTMNVFFVFKDEIVTPPLNGSILAGGMREAALTILRHQGQSANERRVTIQELIERTRKGELLEAFGTGTAAVVSPIGEYTFRGETFKVGGPQAGPVGQNLFNEITAIQRGTKPDLFGWMKRLGSAL